MRDMQKKNSGFHISKRKALPWYASWGIRGAAILLALVVCAAVTALLTGEDPIRIYATIFEGAFGTARKTWILFQDMAILLCVSIAVTPAFRMRFWNIGGEGQVLMGGLATAACMILLGNKLPNYLLIPIMVFASVAAGINITRYKYASTCLGCMIAGLGGLYYVMDYASGVWSNNAFGDRGWLAIALVIFTIWRPSVSIPASMLFGGLYILHLYIPTGMNLAVKELYKMLPYIVTIVVLIITSMRNKRESQPPASLGLPYFREER